MDFERMLDAARCVQLEVEMMQAAGAYAPCLVARAAYMAERRWQAMSLGQAMHRVLREYQAAEQERKLA